MYAIRDCFLFRLHVYVLCVCEREDDQYIKISLIHYSSHFTIEVLYFDEEKSVNMRK